MAPIVGPPTSSMSPRPTPNLLLHTCTKLNSTALLSASQSCCRAGSFQHPLPLRRMVQTTTHDSHLLGADPVVSVARQVLIEARVAGAHVEVVGTAVDRPLRLILGDHVPCPDRDPDRLSRPPEVEDTARDQSPIHAAGRGAHRHPDVEEVDDMMMKSTDDAASAARATAATAVVEEEEADQEIVAATADQGLRMVRSKGRETAAQDEERPLGKSRRITAFRASESMERRDSCGVVAARVVGSTISEIQNPTRELFPVIATGADTCYHRKG